MPDRAWTIGLCAALIGAATAAFAEEPCTSCASEIALTKAQIDCLEARIETYVRADADPVMVSLLDCDSPAVATGATSPSAAPVVAPIIDATGDADAADKLLFLTRRQIICLRDSLDRLKAETGEPVVFKFSNCD